MLRFGQSAQTSRPIQLPPEIRARKYRCEAKSATCWRDVAPAKYGCPISVAESALSVGTVIRLLSRGRIGSRLWVSRSTPSATGATERRRRCQVFFAILGDDRSVSTEENWNSKEKWRAWCAR